MRLWAIHVHKHSVEAMLLQQCREVTTVILSIRSWLPTYMGQSLIRCNKCHLLRRLGGSCLLFPNFHIPPELIHHLPITSLRFCHLILQPFPSQLLLLCPCFHPRKLVGVMLGPRANMLEHLFASVLRSGLGCHLGIVDYQPNIFRKLGGCRLELHEVLMLGCRQGLGLLVEQKVLPPKQYIVSFAEAWGVAHRVLAGILHRGDNPIQAVDFVTD